MKKVVQILAIGSCLFCLHGVSAQVLETLPVPASQPASLEKPADDSPSLQASQLRLRSEADRIRHRADATLKEEEAACHKRYFVFRCIDEAKAQHLSQIQQARSLAMQADRLALLEKQAQVDQAAEDLAKRNEEHAQRAAQPSAPERPLPEPPKPGGHSGSSNGQAAAQRSQEEAAAAQRAAQAAAKRQDYDTRRAKREAERAQKKNASPVLPSPSL